MSEMIDTLDAGVTPPSFNELFKISKGKAHQRYTREKAAREAAIDEAYEEWVAGLGGTDVFALVRRHIRIKAETQHKLRNLWNDSNVITTEDVLQELDLKLYKKIAAKEVKGKLSHYVNVAFKNHFIDAEEELTREWNWRRFLLTESAIGGGDEWVSVAEIRREERESNLANSQQEWGADAYAVTGSDGDDEGDGAIANHIDDAVETQAGAVESRSGPPRQIPLPVQYEALLHVQQRYPKHSTRWEMLRLMRAGYSGKKIADEFRMTESSVSRMRRKLEDEIRIVAQALLAKEPVA